jgi:hypothetical protein
MLHRHGTDLVSNHIAACAHRAGCQCEPHDLAAAVSVRDGRRCRRRLPSTSGLVIDGATSKRFKLCYSPYWQLSLSQPAPFFPLVVVPFSTDQFAVTADLERADSIRHSVATTGCGVGSDRAV